MTKKIELNKENVPENFLTKNQFFECIYMPDAMYIVVHTYCTQQSRIKKKI